MAPEEAIKLLRSMQNPKQDYANLVCAPAFCTGYRYVYPEPEDYAIEEAISALKEVQQHREIGSVGEIKQAIGVLSLSENDIIKTFHELNEYRKIGTVEQVKNQKGNLNVAYQIISDYEQYGTIEDFKKAQRYMRLVNAHGTIGKVIDSCAEYESIGTVEECREAVEKQTQKKCAIDSCPDHTHYKCPSCGQIELSIYKHGFPRLGRITKYCENCGQALVDEN